MMNVNDIFFVHSRKFTKKSKYFRMKGWKYQIRCRILLIPSHNPIPVEKTPFLVFSSHRRKFSLPVLSLHNHSLWNRKKCAQNLLDFFSLQCKTNYTCFKQHFNGNVFMRRNTKSILCMMLTLLSYLRLVVLVHI